MTQNSNHKVAPSKSSKSEGKSPAEKLKESADWSPESQLILTARPTLCASWRVAHHELLQIYDLWRSRMRTCEINQNFFYEFFKLIAF